MAAFDCEGWMKWMGVAAIWLGVASASLCAQAVGGETGGGQAQSVQAGAAAPAGAAATTWKDRETWEYGALVQSGVGLTEDRGGFKFLWAGVHAGKVLAGPVGHGAVRGNLEYAVEAFPLWQSYTPTFYRANCVAVPGNPAATGCSAPFLVGGTFTGVSLTPIVLRWNLLGTRRFSFWGQAGGGVLWTNHKYPAFGGAPYTVANDGANADASVWNFTPQGGVGVHYFWRAKRSIDLGANAIHISSASLGDRNPGVNASVQFSLGTSWWK
jgi:lipid A 3-O-deacylase